MDKQTEELFAEAVKLLRDARRRITGATNIVNEIEEGLERLPPLPAPANFIPRLYVIRGGKDDCYYQT